MTARFRKLINQLGVPVNVHRRMVASAIRRTAPNRLIRYAALRAGVDVGILSLPLTSNDPQSLARRYCSLLAEGSGLDEQAIWEWGFLERVTTGLYVWSLGGRDQNRHHLETAELLT